MSGSGNFWDRFDRKTLLTFTGYQNRVEEVVSEISRVGMNGVNVQWQFPNPFESVLIGNLRHKKGLDLPGYMNCTMGHYSAVKTAYHLGLKTCLIMEDDIAFLKDIDEIRTIVNAIPEDFDVAMLDWFATSPGFPPESVKKCIEDRSANEHWAEFEAVRSCGCYALSRRAMEKFIWLNEAAVTSPAVGKMRICDQFFEKAFMGCDMKMYLSKKNVAVQRRTTVHNSNFDLIADAYKAMGIDVSEYGG